MEIIVLYGGRSVEHVVSISSAKYIISCLKELNHTVKPIYITEEGTFLYNEQRVLLDPSIGFCLINREPISCELVFIMMHGAFGEDGRIQALMELLNLPYVSTDSLSSMLGMHKAIQNQIYQTHNLPLLPYLEVSYKESPKLEEITQKLGKDLLLKPEAGGSSVGIIHLNNPTQALLDESLQKLFKLDDNVLIQPFLTDVEELLCAVYETEDGIKVVGPGVIKVESEFLDYDQKYDAQKHIYFETSPQLKLEVKEEACSLAKRVFEVLKCSIYARVDLFYHKGKIYINEINTIPGFTQFSYFPQLIKTHDNINYCLNQMINNSLALFERRNSINHKYE